MWQPWGGTEISIGAASDVEPFETWYQRCYPKLARSMAVMFGNPDTGRDIANEAMTTAYQRWERGDPPLNPDAWVFTVAIHEGRRRVKRRRRERAQFADDALREPAVAALDPADLDLWRAVAALPPRSREAVVLRYVADLTEAEVARAMGVTTGSASALLTKARRSLEARLTEGTNE